MAKDRLKAIKKKNPEAFKKLEKKKVVKPSKLKKAAGKAAKQWAGEAKRIKSRKKAESAFGIKRGPSAWKGRHITHYHYNKPKKASKK